jgi:glycosyltransferase 2 family protein
MCLVGQNCSKGSASCRKATVAGMATQGIYAGLFVNKLVPLRFGELVRAFMVSRWLSVSFAAILPSIVVERFLDGLWLIAGIGIVAIFVPLPRALIRAGEILGVAVLVATAFFIWTRFRNQQHFGNIERDPQSSIVKLFSYVSRFNQGLRDIGVSPRLFLAAVLSVAMLALQIFVLRFMLSACQIDLSFLSSAFIFLIIRLGTTLPNAPANIGTFQFFTVIGLRSFGVGKTVAAAFSIVYFGALTLPLWTLGLLAITFSGLNLQMARWLWQGRSVSELKHEVDVP